MPDLSALDSWLRLDTWDSHHSRDQERFYKAVYNLILSNDKLVEPQYISDYIIDKKSTGSNKYHVKEIADIYTVKYDVIFSFIFENKINFPL